MAKKSSYPCGPTHLTCSCTLTLQILNKKMYLNDIYYYGNSSNIRIKILVFKIGQRGEKEMKNK